MSLTQAEMLAIAVLKGDRKAALALADEVLATFHSGPKGEEAPSLEWVFGWHTATLLRRSGIEDIASLVTTPRERLRDLLGEANRERRQFGEVSFTALTVALKRHGFSLQEFKKRGGKS